MRQEYNKLVRDNIPEIIHQAGKQCEVEVMSQIEYLQALRNKLIEEAQEAAVATPQDLVKELADLYEVIDTLCTEYQINTSSILAEQERRRAERGGFKSRLRLLWTK
ncbi:nucleoside triphosphate pyrophosphohydrolase [Trichocoleus sp. FACHB-90]|uniref:nucleoside triphosphate pyrophosphohydrolase n=1 Tax=Cyanophyceae TaxID=3028117 RepID=UPI001681DA39|nr:nucleoside triphosphate pyrophosphohydrolase [Trichocoleus sp. FACHB-90]MBD1928101.1 nucleoside triphosphate pyrophosphohydrolase [Trichocoleus sp. FACHB-90]